MINRVRTILRRRHGVDALDSYFFNVQTRSNCPGPTFDEARRDFKEMVSKHIYN